MQLQSVRAVPVTVDAALVVGPAIYAGFSLRETAGAAAVVRLYDNPSAGSGAMVDTVSLAAGESRSELYDSGVFCATGLYFDLVSGTVEGSVRIR